VDTSGLEGKLVAAVRYECTLIGCFTDASYVPTTNFKGLDNLSMAIPEVRKRGPFIIHVYPNEGSFSSYNMFDQCSDDPHWKAEWNQWLASRYRTVAALNRKWRTDYSAFEEIPAVFTHPSRHGDPRANPNLVLLQPIVGADGRAEWILADASEFNAYMLQLIFARTVMQVKKSFGNVVTYMNTILSNYIDDQWQRAIDLWRLAETGLDGIGVDLYGGWGPRQRSDVADLLDACDHGGGMWAFMAETDARDPETVAAKVRFYWSVGLRGMFFHRAGQRAPGGHVDQGPRQPGAGRGHDGRNAGVRGRPRRRLRGLHAAPGHQLRHAQADPGQRLRLRRVHVALAVGPRGVRSARLVGARPEVVLRAGG
jgi:hypothetical protein